MGASVDLDQFAVSVALAEESPRHRDELIGILQRFLTTTGKAPDAVNAMSFEQLIAAASNISRAIR